MALGFREAERNDFAVWKQAPVGVGEMLGKFELEEVKPSPICPSILLYPSLMNRV